MLWHRPRQAGGDGEHRMHQGDRGLPGGFLGVAVTDPNVASVGSARWWCRAGLCDLVWHGPSSYLGQGPGWGFTLNLAGRRVSDVQGPAGITLAAVGTGHLSDL